MNEEIEYAEMLEIPVSTVNVVRKRRRHKKSQPREEESLREALLADVNDRMSASPFDEEESERLDTVRLYSTEGDDETLTGYDLPLNEGGMYELNEKSSRSMRLALGIEFAAACALCAGIFLTNIFLPNSAVNTFFRAMTTPAKETDRPYTDFTLTPVVSELSDAKLELSPEGVLAFTDECCVYPAANGKVVALSQGEDGKTQMTLQYSDSFTGVVQGLDIVYYEVGDSVKANVPVGFSKGESEVRMTMYSDGEPLNCFQLTEENCLAWVSAQA